LNEVKEQPSSEQGRERNSVEQSGEGNNAVLNSVEKEAVQFYTEWSRKPCSSEQSVKGNRAVL
jgi:hypothetical protein